MRGWASVWGVIAVSSLTVAGVAQAAIHPISAPVGWGVGLADEVPELPSDWLMAQGAEAEEALRLYQEGRELFREGTTESLRAAIEKFEAAIPLQQKVGATFGEALTRYRAGVAYQQLGLQPEALRHYEKSLELWQIFTSQATGEELLGSQVWQVTTLNNTAVVYADLGNKNQAIDLLNQALSISQESGDSSARITVLNGLGTLYSDLGDKQRALEFYNQSLTLSRAIKFDWEEANVLVHIGAIYSDLGQMAQALEFYHKALPLHRAANNRRKESLTLNYIARVYDALGEEEQALDLLDQALSIDQVLGDPNDQARTLNNIGTVYYDLGETNQALAHYVLALSLLKKTSDRIGEAATLNNIGAIYDELDQKRKALEYYNRALPPIQAAGNRGMEARTLNNIGRVYDALGDKSQALQYYDQAILLLRAVGDLPGEANTLKNAAWVYRDQNKLTAALTNIKAAIALIEQLRAAAPAGELRQTYFAQQQGYYQFYIDLLMQLHQQNPDAGHDIEAFHISERSRARTLIELLAESQLNLRDDANPALLERERDLLAQLTAQQQLLTQRLSNAQTDAEQDQIRQDYTTATNRINSELDRVIAQLKRQNPAYADLKYPEPLDLQQVQQQVLDDDTVLVQYSLHPDQSYLWLVSKDGYETHILPPQKEIEDAVRRFTGAIKQDANCQNATSPEACRDRSLDRLLSHGETLHDQILAPIAAQIQGKRLLIVPDGALHYVPFAAIPQASPLQRGIEGELYQPLLTQHEIIHAPSATAIATQRQNLANRPPAPKELAIFADPVFSATDSRVTGQTSASPVTLSSTISLEALLSESARTRGLCTANTQLQRLPGTRREAKALQKYSPDALTALDFAANQDWFDSTALEQYQTLVFSTHGCIDSQNPELSGLVLSLVDESGQEQADGFLRLNEIFNLQLNADLVVLSACQTGLGETIKGEGMVGMTRGFMYAGAERVVVSLWNVDDDATAELMSQFYGTLQEGMPAAAALREAQLALWEKYQEPRLWAAFTLQGEWQED